MKVLVAVKRVVDYNARIRVKPDKTGVDLSGVKLSMNPFCEIAMEEAVRMKEAKLVDEVIAVTAGPKGSEAVLRSAMALGADRATHIKTDTPLQPLAVAQLLQAMTEKEEPQIVLLGKQAIDDDCNHTGQMLGGLLKWPQATFASKVEVDKDASTATVTREVDGGEETLSCKLPAVITADLRLNTPRYPAMKALLQAKKKKIETIEPKDLGVDVTPHFETLEVTAPPTREAGIVVGSVDELVDKLKNEAKVL